MSAEKTAPAEIVRDAQAVIDEADAEIAAEGQGADPIDATDLAIRMAADKGVDLASVEGSGKEGRITVPDVDKFIKEREAEAESDVEASADPGTEEVAVEPTTPKKVDKPVRTGEASGVPSLPNIHDGLLEVYHIVRSIGAYGVGTWYEPIVSSDQVDENIARMFGEGWSLIHSQSLGYNPDGIAMLWVLGKFAEESPEREIPYQEILHLTRPVGGMGDDERSITGPAANSLINDYLQKGWDLASVESLDNPTGGGPVNLMWILVR
jgi:hypothetical protein